MSNQRANEMRREAARVMSQLALRRIGIVSNYDPNTYSAKVYLQPEGTESGWLPISTPWSGNSWGFYAPPTTGDIVEVDFQEGGKEAGIIGNRQYGNVLQPLNVPSGEFWIVDKHGNYFKFTDNKVEINGDVEIDLTTPTINITVTTANITASNAVNVTAPNMNLTGDLHVTGSITASGDISDIGGASGTVNHIRSIYDAHTHPAPGGTTGVPNQPL